MPKEANVEEREKRHADQAAGRRAAVVGEPPIVRAAERTLEAGVVHVAEEESDRRIEHGDGDPFAVEVGEARLRVVAARPRRVAREAPLGTEREEHRVAFNNWIRDNGVLDGVVDFDKALRDPAHPTQMLPIYDCGDGLHPSDLGYCTMGDAIDLALFD